MNRHSTSSCAVPLPLGFYSMSRRRAALAMSVFSLFTLSVFAAVSPVRAQADVDRAESQADTAYQIVDAAVNEREEVEAALFNALDRYQSNAVLLAELSSSLSALNETLAISEARQESTRDTFETQAVAAYISAVGSASVLVLDSGSVESAMVTQETLGRSIRQTLTDLDTFLAFGNEIESLRASTASKADQTSASHAQLQLDAVELQELFAAANADVAAAYAAALDADARVADAREAAAAALQATTSTQPRSTSTTAATIATSSTSSTGASSPTTSVGPSTTVAPITTTTTSAAPTTTSAPPSAWPPIPINSATMSWRPLLEQHFSADLVPDALVIIQCESVGNPSAVNPYSGASGLFQFMPGTWAVASVEAGVGSQSVFDGEANIIAASWLAEYYRSRGFDPWRPWSCRSHL